MEEISQPIASLGLLLAEIQKYILPMGLSYRSNSIHLSLRYPTKHNSQVPDILHASKQENKTPRIKVAK
jgi:hypothetical protein